MGNEVDEGIAVRGERNSRVVGERVKNFETDSNSNPFRLDFVNPPLPSERQIRIGELYNLNPQSKKKATQFCVAFKFEFND